MLLDILSIIAPILVLAFIGFLWSYYQQPYHAQFVSKLVMNIGCPCLILSSLSESNLTLDDLLNVGAITLAGLLAFYLFNRVFIAFMGDEPRVYLSALTFANTGNMGVPICLFAFGQEALALSLALFMVTSLLHFSFGVAWASGESAWRTLLKSPVFYSTILAFMMVAFSWQLPKAVFNTLDLIGAMAIPLMLFSLGVSLHSLQTKSWSKGVVYALARLLSGFGIGLLLAWAFDIDGMLKGIIIIQAAMPSAVFNYLIAERFHDQSSDVAAVVVSSTVLSFLSLPFLLWFVL